MSSDLILDPERCALIIQDLQNDVITDGGVYADTGSATHAKEQDVVANVADLAAACRARGVPVLHVWYIVEPGAPGLKVNAPLFEGVKAGSTVRGTWGAAPVDGVEPQEGDLIVEKMRMSAWEGTRLEALLSVHRGDDLDALVARVHDAVRAHRGPREADDDATLLALRALVRSPPGNPA